MVSKMVLFLGLTFLGSLAAPPQAPNPPLPDAPMCQPAATLPDVETAGKCLPRGSSCEYSHDCCSSICRTIKGSKSCS